MNVMMFNTSELILDAVILSIVASTPEGISGFKIVQNVRSKIDVPENTFYPLLKQMQADGYLEVYHKDIGGRSRRFYKITDTGRERLTYCQQTWNSYLQGASSLLMSGAAETAPASQPQAVPVSDSQAAPVMNAAPQAVPVSGSQPLPVMNAAPQAAPVPEPQPVPVMNAAPQAVPASGSQPVPVMNAAPQAVPVSGSQPVPVMNAAPQAVPASGSQPLPVMNAAPQAAPVPEPQPVPVMNATPQINPAMMQQAAANIPANTEDTFHIGGATNAMMDFDFSIGDDETGTSDDMGFSSDGDLFEFENIPATSFISYDDGTAGQPAPEPVAQVQPEPVYQEPVTETTLEPVAQAQPEPVYQEPVTETTPEPVAQVQPEPVYQEPVTETTPEPVAQVQPEPVYQEPVTETTPEPVAQAQPELVYQEPADEPATETIDMNAEPIYQEPADEPATETINMNAEPVYQEPADEPATETIDMNAPEDQPVSATDEVSADTAVEDDEADFLAEMAMGDSEEENDDLPELESSVSDIATINALESMLTQLRSFESVMEAHPEPAETTAAQNTAANLNINDINAVAAMLNPEEAAETSDTTSSTPHGSSSTSVRYAEVRNKETDDSVNSLVDLLKDDDQPKKRGFFGRGNKKKNIPKELISDTPRSSSVPIPGPSKNRPIISESSPVPTSASQRAQEVRNADSDDSVNSLVDLLKEDNSSSRRKGRKSSRSGADEFRATAADISAMSSSVPIPKQTSSSNPLRSFSSSTPLRAFSSSNPLRSFSSSTPVTPAPKPEVSQSKPVSRSSYREAPSADDVGGLADLLMEGKESKSATPKIFKQKNSYAKYSSSQPLGNVSSETPVPESDIPDPSVSEPRPYKPSAGKSFDEKAASPNARPVETTATITKPLEAKAISTKPAEAKPVEAKSVETKAVVTPKPEPAEAAPAKPEEAPMDDFKRRLLQAHLINDDNGEDK